MTGENDNRKKEAKGFAGLSDLVPDIDATPPPVARPEPRVSAGGMPAPTKTASSPPPVKPPNQNRPRPVAPPPSSDSSAGKWVLGIALVFGVLWLIGQADKSPSSRSAGTPGAATQAPTRPEESKPPIGQDLVFSAAQIRYCLAEDIRMDAAKSVLNNYSDADVDQFNAMVSDYNSRCGSFRYRSGALESARRDIEPYRSQLQTEGRSRFARSLPTGAAYAPATSRPAPDATVQETQIKLNELGYNSGTADGLMGRDTRSAIMAFQRDAGVAMNGIADRALLRLLEQALSRSTNTRGTDLPPGEAQPYSSAKAANVGQPQSRQIVPTADERSSMELACIMVKSSGPAAYNGCIAQQMEQLALGPRTPSMSTLSYDEKSAIELSCILTKSEGPARYNGCLVNQIQQLERGPRQPDLRGLSYDEKSAIELACILTKSDGAASYNRCLNGQLSELKNAPRTPSLDGLDYQTKSSIQLACITEKSSGAATYNRCLVNQLRSIGR